MKKQLFIINIMLLTWVSACQTALAQGKTTIIGTTKGKNISSTSPSVVSKATVPKTTTTSGTTITPAPSVVSTTLPSFSFLPTDSVFLAVENQQKFVLHTIKAGESPMLLTRFYGVQLTDIYYNNPEVQGNALRVGQILRIPIGARAIRKHTGSDFRLADYVPVYYKVAAGDNLYRIAKTYFNMPMEVIKHRNQLLDDYVYKGRALHIGWINRTGIPDSLHRYMGMGGALGEENHRLRGIYEANLVYWRDTKKMKTPEKDSEGVACWLKGERFASSNQLYVLYTGLPKGSIVRLENPTRPNAFVYAEVVGELPDTEQTHGTIILVSANVALALGGADARLPIRVYQLPPMPRK
jgi:hypothetical protein